MSDFENLVCPECGEDDFYQDRVEVNRYPVKFWRAFGESVVAEDDYAPECQSAERDDAVTCRNCGLDVDDSMLVTREEYEAEPEEEEDDYAFGQHVEEDDHLEYMSPEYHEQ